LVHIFMTQPKPFYYTARNAFGRSTRVAHGAGICISERAAMRSPVCAIWYSLGTAFHLRFHEVADRRLSGEGRTGNFSAPTGEISQVRLSGDGEPLRA
jgi:hypothetical protein